MSNAREKEALIFFKKGTQAINEFGNYMFGCILDVKLKHVPADIFGKEEMEMVQVMNNSGTVYNIPEDYIEEIKYL